MQAIVQNLQGLQDMAPILAFIIQSLVEHIHNLVEVAGAFGPMSVRR